MEQSPSWSLGEGDYSIDLSAFCQGLETKAGKAGEDAYNENKLVYIDWFVFKSSSDEDAALISGRLTPSSPVTGSASLGTICLDNVYPSQSSSFYVYAVANLPGYSDHNAMPKTLAGLNAVPVSTAFNQQDFEPQESFVMRGGVDGITFTSSDRKSPKAVSIPLTRLAAKVSVDLNVVPAIDERETLADGSKRYLRTWYPDVENMEVYLSFANSHTSIEGTPVSYNNSFFTYYRTCFDPVVPSAQPSWDSGKWAITGTPFYTYPMTWDSDSPQAPFLKVILRWTAYDESQNGTVDPVSNDVYDEDNQVYTSTFRHQRNKPAAYMLDDNGDPVVSGTEVYKEFYYKIPLTNLDDTYGTLEANDWLEITADLSILGSTSDDLPVILSGKSYVTDWGVGTASSGELRQAKYLSLDRYYYEIFAQDEITIPVISSHNLTSYKVKSATYYDFSNGNLNGGKVSTDLTTWNSTTKQLADPDRITFNENNSFTLYHQLITDYTNPALDCSAITYVLTVTNEGGKESEEITIKQYPPLYIDLQPSNDTVFVNGVANSFKKADHTYLEENDPVWTDFASAKMLPIYDDKGPDLSFTPTLNNTYEYYNNNDPVNYDIAVEFDVQNPASRMPLKKDRAGNNHGSVTVKATSPYYIYRIDYSFYYTSSISWGNSDYSFETDLRMLTQSTPNHWYGEARSVKFTYLANADVKLSGITVHYHTSNHLGTITDPSHTNAKANTNLYTISVTDVSQMAFFIADTRRANTITYNELTAKGTSSALTGYYPLNTDSYNNNAIAPKFVVASTNGGSYGGAMRFESALERCASYQEAGYPAGRWRLPTDAEIKFIVNLSANHKIPTLFSGRFWGNSGTTGNAIRVNPPGTAHQLGTPNDETELYEENTTYASVRCIYPLWYWGDAYLPVYRRTWSGYNY